MAVKEYRVATGAAVFTVKSKGGKRTAQRFTFNTVVKLDDTISDVESALERGVLVDKDTKLDRPLSARQLMQKLAALNDQPVPDLGTPQGEVPADADTPIEDPNGPPPAGAPTEPAAMAGQQSGAE